MAPVLQHRLGLGHMSLLAQWLPLPALALYFKTKQQRFDMPAVAGFTGLALLANFIHLYIYVMTAGIAAAGALQALIDGRAPFRRGLFLTVLLLLSGVAPLWVFGLLGAGDLAGTQGYGYGVYSMNVVSPFWPQTSGLFRWTGIYWLTRGSIGATQGQYDGFNYLGIGVLFMLGIAILRDVRHFRSAIGQHVGLVIMLSIL